MKPDPTVFRGIVHKAVQVCQQCQSSDPVPSMHEAGEIHVPNNLVKLAIDVIHYHDGVYLLMVDCGPGRIAMW